MQRKAYSYIKNSHKTINNIVDFKFIHTFNQQQHSGGQIQLQLATENQSSIHILQNKIQIATMEYYIAKGKRRREERAVASTAETYRTKSVDSSTTSLTTTSYDDDSDDELGAEIYRTSLTAKRFRDEQQALSTSIQTTTRRKSSRLEGTKSKLSNDSVVCSSIPTFKADTNNTKRFIRSNKRKAVIPSADVEICKEVADNNRVPRKQNRRIFSSMWMYQSSGEKRSLF